MFHGARAVASIEFLYGLVVAANAKYYGIGPWYLSTRTLFDSVSFLNGSGDLLIAISSEISSPPPSK
jgi:hypothetical protein